ncbi:MAG: efflux RND transporter periplasmic adaptor subunit [Candidatus Cloacimonadota bacterium]|nr:efflux RND transporter periplasmic adaptor subunit [Candidatus Cloacimonadota bacterium]
MFKFKKIIILLIIITLAFGGCDKKTNGNSDRAKTERRPGFAMEAKAVPVIIQEVIPENLQEYVKVVGSLEGITDIVFTSETNGKVLEVHKYLGDWVEKGQTIGRIDNSDYKIQVLQSKAGLSGAQASLESAQLNLQSSEKLYKENKISQQEFLQAKIAKNNATAALEGAKVSLEMKKRALENSEFVAPVSGYITNLNIEIGEMIGGGNPICTIVNSKKLKIKTGLSESDILNVKKGQSVMIKNNGFKETFTGKITGVGIKPLRGTANYPIEIEIENQNEKLLPGMVVEGYIQSKTHKDVFFTSMNNILEKYDDKYVYIIDENNKAYEQKVELGKKVKRDVIITNGLKKGDKLVVEGYDNLSNGAKVEIKSY